MDIRQEKNQINEKMSLVELANLVLLNEQGKMPFTKLFEEVVTLKKLTAEERERNLLQFYTDLNMDGRFITLGSNVWGLKQWFPLSQTGEKILKEANKGYETLDDND